jgi:hypothetical protein
MSATSARVKDYPTRKFLNLRCFSRGTRLFLRAFRAILKVFMSEESCPKMRRDSCCDTGAIVELM